jgi:hypothetical protein
MQQPNVSIVEDFSNLPDGLDVLPLSPKPGESITISDRDEHCYYCYNLENGQAINVDHLSCASVFLPIVNNNLKEVTVNGQEVSIGGSALAELTSLEIKATKGSGYVLIAGSREATPDAKEQLLVHTADEHYVVDKPWGHELWINGEHPVFSFKEVFITEGNQTSLQYHNYKIEAALLYDGVCDIVYKSNEEVSNDYVQESDLGVIKLAEKGKICVDPGTLHRMRAATDMYHYEVSTPHLDDVVRVQDDNKRGHGRIQEEHRSA